MRLRLVAASPSPDGAPAPDAAPVFWSDNYLVLRVGESRTVTCEVGCRVSVARAALTLALQFPDSILDGAVPAVAWDFGGGGSGAGGPRLP